MGNGWKKVKRDINCVCAGGTIRSFPSLHLFIAAYSFCKHIKNVLGNRNLKPYYTEGAKKYISLYKYVYVCVCVYINILWRKYCRRKGTMYADTFRNWN